MRRGFTMSRLRWTAPAPWRGSPPWESIALLIGVTACNTRPAAETHSEPPRPAEPVRECRKPEQARRVTAIAGELEPGSSLEREMRARFPAIHIQEGQPVTLDNGIRLTLRN